MPESREYWREETVSIWRRFPIRRVGIAPATSQNSWRCLRLRRRRRDSENGMRSPIRGHALHSCAKSRLCACVGNPRCQLVKVKPGRSSSGCRLFRLYRESKMRAFPASGWSLMPCAVHTCERMPIGPRGIHRAALFRKPVGEHQSRRVFVRVFANRVVSASSSLIVPSQYFIWCSPPMMTDTNAFHHRLTDWVVPQIQTHAADQIRSQ